MLKEKGGAAFSKEAFYIDATRPVLECCGMQCECKREREAKRQRKRYNTLNNEQKQMINDTHAAEKHGWMA